MNSIDESLRITADIGQSVEQMAFALTSGNVGAVTVLANWFWQDHTEAILGFMTLDLKHLYDEHIWEVYRNVCGEDLNRFIYHVQMELPNQATGQHSMNGRYIEQVNPETFASRRRFGKPGSYWALEVPPIETDYAYPLF